MFQSRLTAGCNLVTQLFPLILAFQLKRSGSSRDLHWHRNKRKPQGGNYTFRRGKNQEEEGTEVKERKAGSRTEEQQRHLIHS